MMLTAMLDQETGLRGYLGTSRATFLEPYNEGRRSFDRIVAEQRDAAGGDDAERAFEQSVVAARSWQQLAVRDEREARRGGRMSAAGAEERKLRMDVFREANAVYRERLVERRDQRLDTIRFRAMVAIVSISLVVAAAGAWIARSGTRRELDYRSTQAEFSRAIQSAGDEPEADRLLKRHLERTVTAARVHVLRRDGAEDKLEAATPLDDAQELAAGLADASPRDCLAVRTGASHDRKDEADPLVTCTVCGRAPGRSTCRPLLVGDRVIGSVLVQRGGKRSRRGAPDRRLGRPGRAGAGEPAEPRARRAARGDRRAHRPAEPPGAAGHDEAHARPGAARGPPAGGHRHRPRPLQGDQRHAGATTRGDAVLAAVGAALSSGIRGSDFAGRTGGEEFVVVLPDTDAAGAAVAAEALRGAIAATRVPEVRGRLERVVRRRRPPRPRVRRRHAAARRRPGAVRREGGRPRPRRGRRPARPRAVGRPVRVVGVHDSVFQADRAHGLVRRPRRRRARAGRPGLPRRRPHLRRLARRQLHLRRGRALAGQQRPTRRPAATAPTARALTLGLCTSYDESQVYVGGTRGRTAATAPTSPRSSARARRRPSASTSPARARSRRTSSARADGGRGPARRGRRRPTSSLQRPPRPRA